MNSLGGSTFALENSHDDVSTFAILSLDLFNIAAVATILIVMIVVFIMAA